MKERAAMKKEVDELYTESLNIKTFLKQSEENRYKFLDDVYQETVEYTEKYCQASPNVRLQIWLRYGIDLPRLKNFIKDLRNVQAGVAINGK